MKTSTFDRAKATKYLESLPIEQMSEAAFNSLPEYSMSIPTGTRIGKTWKRRVPAFGDLIGWAIGEYVSCRPDYVGIAWRRIEIAAATSGAAPR